MNNEVSKKISDAPDFGEDFNGEESWDDFSRMLWHLVNELDVSTIENVENYPPETVDKSEKSADSGSLENARKKDCLSFDRCSAAAEKPMILSSAEQTHLSSCRYCESRIAAFAGLLPTVEKGQETSEILPVAELPKKSWLDRFFPKTDNGFRLNWSQLKFGLASLAVILTFGLIFLIVQFEKSGSKTDIAAVENAPVKVESNSANENRLPANLPEAEPETNTD